MSTITAVQKNGMVAIAADQMTSSGSRKCLAEYRSNPTKIVQQIAEKGVEVGCRFDDGSGLPVESYAVELGSSLPQGAAGPGWR
jgi:hypothetical protein